jgi:hypothetical protein
MSLEEKVIDFLKKNKKVSRIEVWDFLKNKWIAEDILYFLYENKKIKIENEGEFSYIIWNE